MISEEKIEEMLKEEVSKFREAKMNTTEYRDMYKATVSILCRILEKKDPFEGNDGNRNL